MKNFEIMKDVLLLEAKMLEIASQKLDEKSVDLLSNIIQGLISTNGNLIFCGVGKSGIIGKKLASTFSSLGLSSFFLHPVEALHGDLGRVRKNDAIVFISKSGTTEEIIKLLPFLEIPRSNRIGLLGATKCSIGNEVGVLLDCSVEKEACLNNQAPTTSSTLALAMGDAMAVLFESMIGLSKEGFAVNHPGGLLGKSLRIKVSDLTLGLKDVPLLNISDSLKSAILGMTKFPVGGAAVVNDSYELLGILVEGDIRRYFANDNHDLSIGVVDLMNKQPATISSDKLAYEALEMMEKRKNPISILPVVDNKKFIGFIRLHDLLKEGFSSSQS